MVDNPQMPYKEDWTIEQLFEDRGWIWEQYIGLQDKNGNDIYEGDVLEVCVFFVSPQNPDDDNHFRGFIVYEGDSFVFHITEYLYSKGWEKLSETKSGFPFDSDWIQNGIFKIPLSSLCAMSGNLGEYDEENVEVIGNIHEKPEML
jgi:uncharacterized phage protein (TIGR01671 family)